ncbi:MAG: conserved hypothetical rane protein [Rhodocyclaceae bacterium]|nr:conserved hypothetical rane protein [Rhodocyclaceae bacterium]
MPVNFSQHPLRQRLNDEIHARPPVPLEAPTLVSLLAFLHDGTRPEAERAHLGLLYERLGRPVEPNAEAAHLIIDGDGFRLKWERHGEFSTYAFFRSPSQPAGGGGQALDAAPADWVRAIPGQLIAATHLELLSASTTNPQDQLASLSAAGEVVVASRIAGGAAWVFTDFRIRDGFSRYIVVNENLDRLRAGRTVQRLMEFETYRIMALLAFPVAKAVGKLLKRAEEELAVLIDRMASAASPDDERAVLGDLTRLAAEVEHSVASTNYRFGAAAAYYRLVQQRMGELKESHIAGLPTIRGFMERRLAPALNTCATIAHRQEDLSARIARTSQLLRTRVDIELERQNQEVLHQMNRRAKLQLRLQETVEGLSVVVLTYYGSQLVQYLAKGTKDLHHFSPDMVTAAAIPIIASFVAWGTHRMRKKLAAEAGEAH